MTGRWRCTRCGVVVADPSAHCREHGPAHCRAVNLRPVAPTIAPRDRAVDGRHLDQRKAA